MSPAGQMGLGGKRDVGARVSGGVAESAEYRMSIAVHVYVPIPPPACVCVCVCVCVCMCVYVCVVW